MKARFLTLWIAAVGAAAAAFIAHLALRLETVKLGYDVGEARREQIHLVEMKRRLSLEAETLSDVTRVEAVAVGALRMHAPSADRVVSVRPRNARRPIGGGVR